MTLFASYGNLYSVIVFRGHRVDDRRLLSVSLSDSIPVSSPQLRQAIQVRHFSCQIAVQLQQIAIDCQPSRLLILYVSLLF